VIARCIAIKARVVADDEREAGVRAILNLGHTVGHGYEAASGYSGLRHGEAVGLGLVAEARWAVRQGLCEPGLPDRIAALLAALGLPARPPALSREAELAAMRLDKKADGSNLRLPVPARAGHVVVVDLPVAALADLLPELT
jgi:3-dehydroquinate synthase